MLVPDLTFIQLLPTLLTLKTDQWYEIKAFFNLAVYYKNTFSNGS